MARVVMFCAAALYGCEDVSVLVLGTPELDGAKSAIVAVDSVGPFRVFAYPVDGASPILVQTGHAAEEISSVEVLLYDQTLSELEISGPELREPTGEQLAASVPANPLAVFHNDLEGGAEAQWSETATLSQALQTFQFGVDARCGALESITQNVPVIFVPTATSAELDLALPLDSEAALVAQTGFVANVNKSGFFRSTPDSLEPVMGCEDLVPLSGSAIGGNRFWVGTRSGELHRLRIDERALDCTVEQTTAPPPDLPYPRIAYTVASSEDEESFELYTMSGVGQVSRFDGSRWEQLFKLPLHPDEASLYLGYGALIRLGPQHIMASSGANEIREWKDGVLGRSEKIPGLAGADRVRTLVEMPDGRILSVVSTGAIYLREQSVWRPIAAVPDDAFVLEPYRRGWAALSKRGQFFYYDELYEYLCPAVEQVGGALRPKEMLITSLGVFLPNVFPAGDDGRPAQVLWLVPEDPGP